MSVLTITDRVGKTQTIEPADGRSVMQALRAAGYDDILALCGGSCSCATCHVIVHPDDFAQLTAMTEEEEELLEDSAERTPTSRLSCQIKLNPSITQLRITIPKEG